MSINRCSRCVVGNELKGHVDCSKPYLEIQDGGLVEINPLDSKKEFDPEMFLIENLANSGIELRELHLESNDVLGAANIVNGTIDVVNFIGIQKSNKKVIGKTSEEIVNPEETIETK